ncbi:hypothetical protein QK289_15695 [Exiguobacterium antarcticum]|uniref:Uncharacterized protein n=1 Tax=Exiguobacterium antarcticum TaxID=132920 RepID=A0ABT6R824_9BACL|nr:hypothetical protein [Exiguobacterium antarcticum]MDI3236459.1 hypothetical protein [Exiguobacterium antarcticum]
MPFKTFAIRNEAILPIHYLRGLSKLKGQEMGWNEIFGKGLKEVENIKERNHKIIAPPTTGVRKERMGHDFKDGVFDEMKRYAKHYGLKQADMIELFAWIYFSSEFTEREKEFFKINEWIYYVEEL